MIIPGEDVQPNQEAPADAQNAHRKQAHKNLGASPKEDLWAGPKVRFDLPRGNFIEIRLKSKVTPQEFQKIKKIFDLSELAFLEDDNSESGQE